MHTCFALLFALAATASPALAQKAPGKKPPVRKAPPADTRSYAEVLAAWEASQDKPIPERYRALRAFSRFKTAECVQLLAAVARAPNRQISPQAMSVLGIVGIDPATSILEGFLSGADATKHAPALRALANIRPRLPVDRFLAALDKAQPLALRMAAFSPLQYYPEKRVVIALATVLAETPPKGMLQGSCTRALRVLINKPPLDSWFVEEALSKESSLAAALPHLLRIATACEHPGLVEAITPHLESARPAVRGAALDALGELFEGKGASATATLDALTPLLEDPDASVFLSAALAVGRIGPVGDSLEAVLKLAKSKNPGRRASAITALGRVQDERATNLVCKALKDRSFAVRAAAIATSRKVGGKPVVAALIEALKKNKTGRLHAEILRALTSLTNANPGPTHKDWNKWWSLVQDDYDLAAAGKKSRPVTGGKHAGGTATRKVPTYYGTEIVSKRITFIVDVSGSMSAQIKRKDGSSASRLDVCKAELAGVIKSLSKKTRFNVVFFHTIFQAWSERIVPANRKQKASALKFVAALKPTGGTNIYDPLEAALRDPEVDTIYFLSDGAPGSGKYTRPDDICREVRKLNAARQIAIHTIAVGAKSPLLEQLAKENSGRAVVR